MKVIRKFIAAVLLVNAAAGATVAFSQDHAPATQPKADVARAKLGDQVPCAIDGMKMPLEATTPYTEYRGKTYYFCSEKEKQNFLNDPERYAKN